MLVCFLLVFVGFFFVLFFLLLFCLFLFLEKQEKNYDEFEDLISQIIKRITRNVFPGELKRVHV